MKGQCHCTEIEMKTLGKLVGSLTECAMKTIAKTDVERSLIMHVELIRYVTHIWYLPITFTGRNQIPNHPLKNIFLPTQPMLKAKTFQNCKASKNGGVSCKC